MARAHGSIGLNFMTNSSRKNHLSSRDGEAFLLLAQPRSLGEDLEACCVVGSEERCHPVLPDLIARPSDDGPNEGAVSTEPVAEDFGVGASSPSVVATVGSRNLSASTMLPIGIGSIHLRKSSMSLEYSALSTSKL